jgi:molecular chaperone HtpG
MDIAIGKFTLESLTTGMYNEPETCFREYIQNAVDGIDAAVEEHLLTVDESRIEIIIDEERRTISIKDNGIGISESSARKTLLDIGNSSKLHTENRGFRGIGRLGGLSYCKKLSFYTTYKGEETKTIVSFDCELLKRLLIPGQSNDHTLQSVIETITTVSVLEEQESAHYFIVKMEEVDDIASLLDIDLVKDYISQVAPLPFKKNFFWGSTIKQDLGTKGVTVAEYPVFIGSSFEKLTQLYKPYKTNFETSSRAGIIKNEVNGISFFNVVNHSGEALAYGWYADTELSGTLVDERMSGIRVRLGNILIGNSKTLAPFFKESRFNGWVIGELYIVSSGLIPNARRDDFERNDAFNQFEIGVRESVGTEVSSKIRAVSKARNKPSAKIIKKAEREISQAEAILTTGFNSTYEKEQIVEGLKAMQKELRTISKTASSEEIQKKIQLIQTLEKLEENVNKSNNYRTKKGITSDFSRDQKKIVQAMLEVLTRNFERETVDSLYKEFLTEIGKKGKK